VYAKHVYACFVDFEKAYDRVPQEKFWGVLREYGVDGRLLQAVQKFVSFSAELSHSRPQCVLESDNDKGVCCHHSFLSPSDRQTQLSRRGCHVGSCRINRFLFAPDLVLLASSELGFQHALVRFAAGCDRAGMKTITEKSEALCISRNTRQCTLQVSGNALQ